MSREANGEPVATVITLPDGSSWYTLKRETLSPGAHVLEFRLNPEGLPGAEQTSLRLDILVPAEMAETPGAA